MKELPLQKIFELLEYQENSGRLLWKKHRGNKAFKGTVAGTITKSGYIQICVENTLYWAHRIIYAMKTGKTVFSTVDHIDGNRSNNLFSNLREITQSENSKNRMSRGTFKTRAGTWAAGITVDYRKKHLGTFLTEQEAHEAYLAAKSIYHPTSKERKYDGKQV